MAISEKLNDERSLAMVLNSLGGVLQRLGQFQEAADALRKSHQLLVKQGDERGQAMVLNSLGGVLDRLRLYIESDATFEQSIQLGEKLRDSLHLAKVLTAYGQRVLSRGNPNKAVDLLRRGYQIDLERTNRRGLQIVTASLVNALLALRNEDEARRVLDEALVHMPGDLKLLRLRHRFIKPIR